MKVKKQPGNINAESEICPHLGLEGDKESYAAFTSAINNCYRGNKPAAPNFSHQRKYCLSSDFVNCPVLKSNEIRKFPKEIKFKSQGFLASLKPFLIPGIFGILSVLVVFQITFGADWIQKFDNVGNGQSPTMSLTPKDEENHSLAADIEKNIVVVETKTATLSVEILLTKSPKTEPASKPDPVLDLNTPIGNEQKFIIHRVLEGESLQYLADKYQTSPQAILEVNDNIISPIWVGWVVVIPMDTIDVEGLPSFSALQIENEGITLKSLADQLDISVEQLSLYNNIEEEHILHQGEWLLIPGN